MLPSKNSCDQLCPDIRERQLRAMQMAQLLSKEDRLASTEQWLIGEPGELFIVSREKLDDPPSCLGPFRPCRFDAAKDAALLDGLDCVVWRSKACDDPDSFNGRLIAMINQATPWSDVEAAIEAIELQASLAESTPDHLGELQAKPLRV